MDPNTYHLFVIEPTGATAQTYASFWADSEKNYRNTLELMKELGATSCRQGSTGISYLNFDKAPGEGWVKARGRGVSYNSYQPSGKNSEMKARLSAPEFHDVGWDQFAERIGCRVLFLQGLRIRSLYVQKLLGALILCVPKISEDSWTPPADCKPVSLSEYYTLLAADTAQREADSAEAQ